MQPLVTVLMPVYNAEKFLSEAIESILHQTFSDFEFLIINDGSTDNSLDIIKSYDDSRIRVVENDKNIKLIATLNKGFDLAKGAYICRMDADDISILSRLEKQTAVMLQNTDIIACGSWIENFDDTYNKSITKYEEQHDDIRIRTLYQNHICHASTLLNKSLIDKYNIRFDSNFIHSEDYYFFVRLSELGMLYNIQEPLLRVRKHSNNVSVLNTKAQNENSINVINYQLNKIGIDASNIDYNLYFRFFYASFDFNKEEIEIIENIIFYIIEANQKSNYLSNKKLTDFLCEKWYHLCFNATTDGMWIYEKFEKSKLSKYYKINKYKKVRLLIKSIIK